MVARIIHIDEREQVKQTIVERIDVENVLRAYGVHFKRSGGRNQLSSRDCPADRHGDGDAFRFDTVKKLWQCFKCNTKGDVFHYIAAMEGLDCSRDFGQVKARAANLADVDLAETNTDEWRAKNEERERDRERRYKEQIAAELRATASAKERANGYWSSLTLRHDAGVRYLASRGIKIVPSFVRFDRCDTTFADDFSTEGAPVLAVHNFDDGEICGVVRRRIPPIQGYKPSVKAPTLTGTTAKGTLAHSISDIVSGVDVIVLEGIVDSITAPSIWPDAVVLGANGTGAMHQVIFRAAQRARRVHAQLHVVAHADEKHQGHKAVARGLKMARALGMQLGDDLHVVQLDGAKDLNDAHRAGWRPS